MSHLVTGDAVVLGLQPAKLPSRAVAVALDLAVLLAGYFLIAVVLLTAVFPLGQAVAETVYLVTLVLTLVGVPVLVETLSRGRSLGKLAFGLRVVRDDGGPVRFRHALVRGLVGFVELLLTFGFIACVSSLVSPQGRRLGDVFAGTMVVRERIPTTRAGLLPPPPPALAEQFSALDLSQVPDELWLSIRQLLTRMPKLDPAVSWSLSVRLADELARRTGTPPPDGLHPSAYLAAVAGERQRREALRAFGPAPGPAGAAGAGTPGAAGTPSTAAPGGAAETGAAGAVSAAPVTTAGAGAYGTAAAPGGPETWGSAAAGAGGTGDSRDGGRAEPEGRPETEGRAAAGGSGFAPPA